MELAGVLREAMSLGASDVHLKARQYPVLRVRGHLMRLENWPLLDGKDLEQMAGRDDQQPPAPAVRARRGSGRPVHGGRDRPLPGQHLPGPRQHRHRAPRRALRAADVRGAPPAPGRREAGHGAQGTRPGDGPRGLGQDDDARLDGEPHEPPSDRSHRDDRGPDRVPLRGRQQHRHPARGRDGRARIRRGAPDLPPPGPQRGHGGRDARCRDDVGGADAGGDRPPRPLDAPHDHGGGDGQPDHLAVPAGLRAPDPPAARHRSSGASSRSGSCSGRTSLASSPRWRSSSER